MKIIREEEKEALKFWDLPDGSAFSFSDRGSVCIKINEMQYFSISETRVLTFVDDYNPKVLWYKDAALHLGKWTSTV